VNFNNIRIPVLLASSILLLLTIGFGSGYKFKENIYNSKIYELSLKINEKSREIYKLNQQVLESKGLLTDDEVPIIPETYTSDKLKITFNYYGAKIAEIDNKVFLYVNYNKNEPDDPTKGKYVQVMHKDPNKTLEATVREKHLQGYSLSQCDATPADLNYRYVLNNQIYDYVKINIKNFDPNESDEKRKEKIQQCPPIYTYSGRTVNYFVMDRFHPDVYAFVELGQDNFLGGKDLSWDMTLKFLD